jgi:hypothetical protein
MLSIQEGFLILQLALHCVEDVPTLFSISSVSAACCQWVKGHARDYCPSTSAVSCCVRRHAGNEHSPGSTSACSSRYDTLLAGYCKAIRSIMSALMRGITASV